MLHETDENLRFRLALINVRQLGQNAEFLNSYKLVSLQGVADLERRLP